MMYHVVLWAACFVGMFAPRVGFFLLAAWSAVNVA